MDREAAEYLWKISDKADIRPKTSRYSSHGHSSTTTWDNTWGFSESHSVAKRTSVNDQDLDTSLLSYVSDEAEEDWPDLDDLLAESSIKRYDASGSVSKEKKGDDSNTSTSWLKDSVLERDSFRNEQSGVSSNLGNMLESMGIEYAELRLSLARR